MGLLDRHKAIETNATLLMILSLLVVSIGGIVQIVPLFYQDITIEKVEGMRPSIPLSNWRSDRSTSARAATTATAR